MSKAIVIDSQNIVDVALQEYGTVEAIVQLMKDNGLSADVDLMNGQVLSIDEFKAVEFKDILQISPSINKPTKRKQIVEDGLSMVDITIRNYKAIEGILQVMRDNSLAPDSDLYSGQEITIDEQKVIEYKKLLLENQPLKKKLIEKRRVKVTEENMIDVVIQNYGTVEALVQLLKDNSISADSDLLAGQELVINELKAIEFKSIIPDEIILTIPAKKKEVITDGQNIIDVTIQEYGSVESFINLLRDNALTPNDDLAPAAQLIIQNSSIVKKDLVSYLKRNSIRINTGLTVGTINDGIDYMIIEDTFIVQ